MDWFSGWFETACILVGLMSGIVSVLREAYAIHRGPDYVPSRSAYWRTVYIAFVISSFLAWMGEHQKTNRLSGDLTKLTVPILKGQIFLRGLAPAGIKNKDTLLFVVADIENTGAPTIAKAIKAGIKVDGITSWGREINPTEETTAETGMGDTLVFTKPNWLPLKAGSQPIPTGGAVQGFIQVLVDDFPRNKALGSPTAMVVVSFEDIYGHHYETEAKVGVPQKLLNPSHLQPEYGH